MQPPEIFYTRQLLIPFLRLPEQSFPIPERDDGIYDRVDPLNVAEKSVHHLSARKFLCLDSCGESHSIHSDESQVWHGGWNHSTQVPLRIPEKNLAKQELQLR